MYLDETAVRALLGTVTELARPGSWLGADMVNSRFLTRLGGKSDPAW